MTSERRRLTTLIATLSLCASLIGLAAPALAAAPNVNAGAATTVDGDLSEWTAADFFADMYRAGDATKQVESKLSLRYDCTAGILYVAVAAEDGVEILEEDDNNYVKVNDDKLVDGNAAAPDGSQPEFAYADDQSGWEASFAIAPGTYDLNVHTQVDDDGSQTSAVADRSIAMVISCDTEQSSEPQSSEPQSSEPQSSEPQSSEPQSSEPQSSEPQSSEPQSPEESTSSTSTTFPSPVESTSPAESSAATTQSPEQDVEGTTGTPAASMGNTSIGVAGGAGQAISASVAWGLLLLVSAAALMIGRVRSSARA